MGDDETPLTQREPKAPPRPRAAEAQPVPPPTPPPPPPASVDAEAHARIQALERELGEMRQAIAQTQVIRISTPLPSPTSLLPTPPPESRPSRAAHAMAVTTNGTKVFGKYTAYVTLALTILAQVISFFGDPKNGPLVRSLLIIASTMSGEGPAPAELPPPVWTPVPDDVRTGVPASARTEDGSVEGAEERGQSGHGGHGGQRDRR